MSDEEIWRDSNGNRLKFQKGDHVLKGGGGSIASSGFVYAYAEGPNGITYNFGRDNWHNHGVPEDDLELAPEYRIEYSVIGYTETGGNVNVYQWGDWMDIRASGFKTVKEAEGHAPVLFGQDDRVAFVMVQEYRQEWSGGGWRPGREVARIERPAT